MLQVLLVPFFSRHRVVVFCTRIVLVDDSLDCLISFTDFVYALQLRLYYDGEFPIISMSEQLYTRFVSVKFNV